MKRKAKKLCKDGRPFGRPPLPAAERKSIEVKVSLTRDDYRRLTQDAKRAGLSKPAVLVEAWHQQRGK